MPERSGESLYKGEDKEKAMLQPEGVHPRGKMKIPQMILKEGGFGNRKHEKYS